MKYVIPSANIPKLREKIEKINKRATKIQAPAIQLELGEEFFKKDPENPEVTIPYRRVEVKGEIPHVAGWDVIAKIDHDSGVNIINQIQSDVEVPNVYRERTPHCDHCNTKRIKVHSFIIKNVETGETMQVGKSCLQDFIKVPVENVIKYYQWFTGIIDELDDVDSDFYNHKNDYRVPVRTVVAVAVAEIRQNGFKPSSDVNPTKAIVQKWFYSAQAREYIGVKESDFEEADEIIDWICSQSPNNNFIANVHDLISIQHINPKHIGYIVGAVGGYYREKEKKQNNEVLVRNEYVGSMRKRMEMTLTLLNVKVVETYYGTSYLHKFIDDSHHLIIWFASNKTDFEDGKTYKVKATVKKHDEYNGVKQTYVNRVKIIEEK